MPVLDLHQLRTFVTVAREGSVTRASETLHLSQPAVSAHIKSMEETLGLSLFERTARGMSLTSDGQRLLAKAEQTLAAHRELLNEASRQRGELRGKLRLGAGSNSSHAAVGKLLTELAARWPAVEVSLQHGTSREILAGIRSGALDCGFYNDPRDPEPDLSAREVARFGVLVAAAPGLVPVAQRTDWQALAKLPWIYPASSACCGRAAESWFEAKGVRPRRVVSVDRQELTQTLLESGIGLGLLHADAAAAAEARGAVEILFDTGTVVRVFFASAASRAGDPLLTAAATVLGSVT